MVKIYVKNMVCDRCKMAVRTVFQQAGLQPEQVDLGEVMLNEQPSEDQLTQIRSELEQLGFELLDDHKHKVIDQIKSLLIKLVHYKNNKANINISEYLSGELRIDYSSLSKLFSESEGKTIERFYIELRIERVKELISYDELTLTQIAMRMNYSSVAYLSSQFKTITGMTPSQFKSLKANNRTALDEI